MNYNSPEGNDICDFLWYGYIPKPDTSFIDIIHEDIDEISDLRKHLLTLNIAELIKEGKHRLDIAFQHYLSNCSNIQVVPLSGGIDSRLILAVLLEAGFRNQIEAVSFGIPGSLDFEIPQEIAKQERVKHRVIDLNQVPITLDCLRYAYESGASWTELITAYYNHYIKYIYGGSPTYWSGFMGDPIAGSHYNAKHNHLTWTESLCAFASFNKRTGTVIYPAANPKYNPLSSLPPEPFRLDASIISYYEQLDFSIRQTAWIKKAVVGSFRNIATPFTDKNWIKFMTAIPGYCRNGCSLYQQICLYSYPRLFKLRTKSVPGLFIRPSISNRIIRRCTLPVSKLIRKMSPQKTDAQYTQLLNYIDFEEAFRKRKDFIDLAEIFIKELGQSHLVDWANPAEILDAHVKGKDDYSKELLALVSLGANIRYANDVNCLKRVS